MDIDGVRRKRVPVSVGAVFPVMARPTTTGTARISPVTSGHRRSKRIPPGSVTDLDPARIRQPASSAD